MAYPGEKKHTRYIDYATSEKMEARPMTKSQWSKEQAAAAKAAKKAANSK